MPQTPITFTASQSYSNYNKNYVESVFGAEDDLWGASDLYGAAIMDENFMVEFDIDLDGGNDYCVDSIEVEIFYQIASLDEPPPVPDPPFLPDPWADSCYAKGIMVLVGKEGRVAYSTNRGHVWHEPKEPTNVNLWSVDFDGTYFIAVGDYGTIMRSLDGQDWDTIISPCLTNFYTVRANKKIGVGVCSGTSELVARGVGNAWGLASQRRAT